MNPCCTHYDQIDDFLAKNFDIECQNTDDGIRIEVKPKDPEQTKTFQQTVKYLCGLCHCRCCQC